MVLAHVLSWVRSGDVAEWLGSGLQSRVHGFDSRRRLWEPTPVGDGERAPNPALLWHAWSVSQTPLSQTPGPWAPPEQAPPGQPVAPSGDGRYRASVPLGGVEAVEAAPARRSQWRDLVVAAALLTASVLTALASLMSWRDYGASLNPDENGWSLADGTFGRGWVSILVAAALAVGGVLLVSGRRGPARRWARAGSAALIVLPVLEWAFGDGGSRTGPGIGLWVQMIAGLVLMVLIGSLLPTDDLDAERARTGA